MRLITLAQTLNNIDPSFLATKRELTVDEKITQVMCESSFHYFVKKFWSIIEGGNIFIDNWHIKGFCDHLQMAKDGKLRLLVVNIPPRCMKSTIKSMFVAWTWITEPNLRFVHISGDTGLLIKDNVRSKDIIQSALYQKFWGHLVKIRKDINSKKRFANTAGGVSLVKSIRASSIGEGGNFVILDDANSAQDLDSEKQRTRTLNSFDSTISFRFDSTTKFSLINIQQRLHEFDLSGHILSTRNNAVHFCLPMEFEPHRACSTVQLPGTKEVWKDPRKHPKELLWPARFSRDYIENIFKKGLRTPHNIASQLQQSPYPADGNILQREWFQVWQRPVLPQFSMIIQSWDTAVSNEEDACFSAMTTWGLFKTDHALVEMRIPQIMLLNCWRGRLNQPELRKMIKRCYYNCFNRSESGEGQLGRRPNILLIEESTASKGLIDDLRLGQIPITSFHPKKHGVRSPMSNHSPTSKIGRAKLASIPFADGQVWIYGNEGKTMPFIQEFVECAIKYPRGDGADYVDSLSQAILYARREGGLPLKDEVPEGPITDWKALAEEMEAEQHAKYYDILG